ncbi:MAG: hypothetical protein OS130_06895 [Thermodesulfobacteriota bacterium]|jgi:hypothetical protein|nr:MAG: hypothetical protein OS130_06895 [Thermodesulfobacteriota bacterium]
MNDVFLAIDRLFAQLGNVLRYIAPGFVAVLVVWAIKAEYHPAAPPGSHPVLSIILKPPQAVSLPDNVFFTLVLLIAILTGLAIYALHTGSIVRFFGFLIVFSYTIRRADNREKLTKRLGTIRAWEVIFQLDSQRLLRRAAPDKEVGSIQIEIDKWASMLNFLYCSSYFMIIVPLYFCWFRNCSFQGNLRLIFYAGLFVLVCSLISECRITNREIWAVDRYPGGRPRT